MTSCVHCVIVLFSICIRYDSLIQLIYLDLQMTPSTSNALNTQVAQVAQPAATNKNQEE